MRAVIAVLAASLCVSVALAQEPTVSVATGEVKYLVCREQHALEEVIAGFQEGDPTAFIHYSNRTEEGFLVCTSVFEREIVMIMTEPAVPPAVARFGDSTISLSAHVITYQQEESIFAGFIMLQEPVMVSELD